MSHSRHDIIKEQTSYLLYNFLIAAYFDYKDESGFPKPPSYNVATTLPSYDEAERTKAEATIPLVPGRVSTLGWLYVLHISCVVFLFQVLLIKRPDFSYLAFKGSDIIHSREF